MLRNEVCENVHPSMMNDNSEKSPTFFSLPTWINKKRAPHPSSNANDETEAHPRRRGVPRRKAHDGSEVRKSRKIVTFLERIYVVSFFERKE